MHSLWVIRTNKCGSVQLLGLHILPYKIYHLINCILYLLWFHVSHASFALKEGFSLFDVRPEQNVCFLVQLFAAFLQRVVRKRRAHAQCETDLIRHLPCNQAPL